MSRPLRSNAGAPAARFGKRGITLIEVLFGLVLFAILAGMTLPSLDQRRVHIAAADNLVLAELRLARSDAITKTVHFQVTFPNADAIEVSRMLESPPDSGTWVRDPDRTRTLALPSVTQVAPSSVGTAVEFNSRGFAVGLVEPLRIGIVDQFGAARSVEVWPSGQIDVPS